MPSGIKINELPRASQVSGSDLIPKESPAGTGTEAATVEQIRDYVAADALEAIGEAAETAVEQVEEKGEETLASIPSDYSSLSRAITYNAYDIWDGLLTRTNGTSYKVVYTWSGDVCTVTTPNGASSNYSANIILPASNLPASVVPGETYYVRYKTTLGGTNGVRLRIIFRNASDTAISTAYLSENGSVTIPSGTARWHVSLFVGSGVTLANPVTVSNIHFLSAKTNRELETDVASLSDGLSKAVVMRGTLASGTDLDNVKTPGIWVLSSGYSYTNTPIPAGYAGMLLVFPASANSIGQIAYVMTSNMTALHYYVRSAIGGSFLGWKQIDESGNTYNNTYTTEYYDNTYNITCSPAITTDTNNYLASTGDYTDRTGDIQAMLNSTGVCHLGPGRFSVTGVEVPNYGALIGSGPRTVLILDASVTEGYAVKLTTQSAVSDMRITSLAAPELSQNVGTRHGVLFEGTANAQTSPQTFKRSRVSGCIISNFTGGGITCRNTGLSPASSLVISNCQIFSCNAGVNISFFSEFHRVTNVTAQECYYGCVCNGGNNNFANCDFSANKMALLIDNSTGQSTNNTHGTFSACSFHHSDNTYENGVIVSVGTAIRILGASAGEIFTGCQIGFGNLEIEDSVGIRFDSCNFLRMTALGITDSPLVVFSDCTFYDANSSPLTQSGNTTLKFADCYLRSGSVYNPMA